MRANKRVGIISLLLIGMFFIVPVVSAHPLGNFTINHYAGIHISANQIWIEYVLDMAEIPAFQEISLLDKNQNGKADPEELVGYPERQCGAILRQLEFERNGTTIAFTSGRAGVSFPPGAGGLSTMRLTCTFDNANLQVLANERITFQDNSYPDRIGWREIVVSAEGVHLDGQFASSSISNKLSSYPQDMLSSPLDVRQINLKVNTDTIEQSGSTNQVVHQPTSTWSAGVRSDRFTQLITLQDMTPASIFLALGIAFLWGGLHSLTPGHGKTIVGAYLVGSRGTALHAVYLGLMTTITHTAGVFVLGLITLFASRYILPEQLFPWISLLSGGLVVTIGIVLFASRLRSSQTWTEMTHRLRRREGPGFGIPGKARPVVVPLRISAAPSRVPIRISGISVIGAAPHQHEDSVSHQHGAGQHTHSHGPGGHTHLPPQAAGSKVTWRSLMALGISGGLLPCPSALVVMLGAIALHRVGFGIVLVIVFSLGLAGVLTGIGLMLVYARRFFDRLSIHTRFAELIPVGSALFISALGIGITLQALTQLGWIKI